MELAVCFRLMVTLFNIEGFEKRFRSGHVSLWRIGLDEHVGISCKVRFLHARRPDHDNHLDTLALDRAKVPPDCPGVVAAARKA